MCHRLLLPLEEVDELVVHDQDERAPDAAEAVAEVALEEGLAALVLEDLLPAVHGALGEGDRIQNIITDSIQKCH